MMARLIVAAALIAAITAPAFACEWNKSAGADGVIGVSPRSGLFNALFFGGMGRVSLKCHTPTQTAL